MTVTRPDAAASTTRITVILDGARVRVGLDVTGPATAACLRPVLLGADDRTARVCLVAEGALLLAGDDLRIEVEVGPGARLVLTEPAGAVAYDMRGGRATWTADLRLAEGASLVWAGEPFVVTDGADVDRTTRLSLAPGASAVLRETVVLGRHRESGTGRGAVGLEAYQCGAGGERPILVESLRLGTTGRLPGMLGGHRVLESVTALGLAIPAGAAPDGRLDLDHGGTAWRRLAGDLHILDRTPWETALRATPKTPHDRRRHPCAT